MRVPVFGIIESPLLNPASEILLADLVGKVKQRMLRLNEAYGRVFIGNAFVAQRDWKRSKLRSIASRIRIPFKRFVIENNQRPAVFRIIKQTLICRY